MTVVGVFGEHAARITRCGFLPRLAAGRHFFAGDVESHLAFLSINADGVAVLHECNRPADVGFGRHVADHEAVAAAAETSVGDERDVFAEDPCP